jgi:hypothetical protein
MYMLGAPLLQGAAEKKSHEIVRPKNNGLPPLFGLGLEPGIFCFLDVRFRGFFFYRVFEF